MADVQKSVTLATTDPGDDIVRVALELASTTSVAASSLISKYIAFTRAFAETPAVLGINLVSGATLVALAAKATASGVTIYARGIINGDTPDSGNVVVEATLKGRLA